MLTPEAGPAPEPVTVPQVAPGTPVAPSKQGMSGCLKAALIGGGILLVLGIVVVIFVINRVNTFLDESGIGDGITSTDEGCSFISDAQASEVLGTSVTAQSGDSLIGAILGMIRDTRLLADDPSCFISDEESSLQVWISVHDGSNAAEVFTLSRDVASGQVVSQTSTEQGSLVVESMPFIGSDVDDLGDEAFCVQAGALPYGGVLARRGDRVVFVSLLAGTEGGDGSAVLGDALCEDAQPLARHLLG